MRFKSQAICMFVSERMTVVGLDDGTVVVVDMKDIIRGDKVFDRIMHNKRVMGVAYDHHT
jgi:hypothetical protein